MPKLTTKFIENVKQPAVRREIPDAGCRGLYLVVQPTGGKAWAARYRFEGKPKKLMSGSMAPLKIGKMSGGGDAGGVPVSAGVR